MRKIITLMHHLEMRKLSALLKKMEVGNGKASSVLKDTRGLNFSKRNRFFNDILITNL